jgi:squalene cyclase
VAFRLLGLPADDDRAVRARAFIHAHGTALACASWGKFTLALLNLYEYDGLQPVLPELWLLPASLPFHPSRFWCHCRQVYLAHGVPVRPASPDAGRRAHPRA